MALRRPGGAAARRQRAAAAADAARVLIAGPVPFPGGTTLMATLDDLLEDLVTANHVLAKLGLVDSFGHIRVRHPERPDRFFLSCSRAPERVTRDDILEFNLECEPIDAKGKQLYTERPIHGGAYQARPDVMCVIHNHSPGVIPYGITGHKLR